MPSQAELFEPTFEEKLELLRQQAQEAREKLEAVPNDGVSDRLTRYSSAMRGRGNSCLFEYALGKHDIEAAFALANVMTPEEINRVMGSGKTALRSAIDISHTIEGQKAALVEKLLERGADPNNCSNDRWETSALGAAIRSPSESAGMVQVLLEHGADVNANYARYNSLGAIGEEPLLHTAVRVGNMFAVDMLLAKGVDINRNGNPLVVAAGCKDDREAIIEKLIEKGADPQDPHVIQEAATVKGHSQTLRQLFSHGASANVPMHSINGSENLNAILSERKRTGLPGLTDNEISDLTNMATRRRDADMVSAAMKLAQERSERSTERVTDVNGDTHEADAVKTQLIAAAQAPEAAAFLKLLRQFPDFVQNHDIKEHGNNLADMVLTSLADHAGQVSSNVDPVTLQPHPIDTSAAIEALGLLKSQGVEAQEDVKNRAHIVIATKIDAAKASLENMQTTALAYQQFCENN